MPGDGSCCRQRSSEPADPEAPAGHAAAAPCLRAAAMLRALQQAATSAQPQHHEHPVRSGDARRRSVPDVRSTAAWATELHLLLHVCAWPGATNPACGWSPGTPTSTACCATAASVASSRRTSRVSATTQEPLNIHSLLEPGTRVGLLPARANRDPEAFARSLHARPRPQPEPPRGFGTGAQCCLGRRWSASRSRSRSSVCWPGLRISQSCRRRSTVAASSSAATGGCGCA